MYKIMFVDNSPLWINNLKEFAESYQEKFEAFFAKTVEEANAQMLGHRFSCVVLDIHLGEDVSGIDLARWYREINPYMGIVLLTSHAREAYSMAIGALADDCLSKPIGFTALAATIENAIKNRTMPHKLRVARFATLQKLLPHMNAVKYSHRICGEAGSGIMEGYLAKDDMELAWDIYKDAEVDEFRSIVGMASCRGCVGYCKFCKSGRRTFKRPLEISELVAQILHSLHGYQAMGVFQGFKRLEINSSDEGDVVFSNLDNFCRMVALFLDAKIPTIGEYLIRKFIATTIGHVGNLKRLINEYRELLDWLWLYISVNFTAEETRAFYMPGTRGTSLVHLKDVLWEFGELTGRNVTISDIVMKGLNDRPEDAEGYFKLFGQGPFDIKLMALQEGSLAEVGRVTIEDVIHFQELLIQAGFTADRIRIRTIIGRDRDYGCGRVVPEKRWEELG
ncbi:MAG: response regulator [bacterium]|nr:response regulator [bacterium]